MSDQPRTGESGPPGPNLPLVLGEPLPHWLRRAVKAVSRAVAALTAAAAGALAAKPATGRAGFLSPDFLVRRDAFAEMKRRANNRG